MRRGGEIMAEFVQIMKDLRRMCIAADDGPDTTKCGNCPLGENRLCSFEISDIDDYELQEAETCITTWAAEHPEPVYPTWGEWLNSLHVVGVHAMQAPSQNLYYPIEDKMNTPIPADIAQMLGIEPKEDA